MTSPVTPRFAGRTLAEQEIGHRKPAQFAFVVTGAAGFLGTPLSKLLAASGARVIGIDHRQPPSTTVSEFVVQDMLDADALQETFNTLVADDAASVVVIHLAARGHVGSNREDPIGAVEANVVATTNVLQACRRAGVRRIVFPSTALVYRLPAEAPVREEAPVLPTSVYAATKLASEALLQAFAVEYGFSCAVARLGNVYGAGGDPDTVVSLVVRQALAGGPVVVNTFAPVRDFIYRDDAIAGLIALATRTDAPGYQVFNLSSGVPTTIGQLAETACEVVGVRTKPTERVSSSAAGGDSLVLSIDRLTASTGWRPTFSLEAGLRAALAEGR